MSNLVIVTGGAGFIGSNLIRHLNERGITNILVVDNLANGHKFANLSSLDIADYLDKHEFLKRIQEHHTYFGEVRTIFHQGACSTTTEWNGRYMMENNFEYSKELLNYCQKRNVPFLYASSAAVYGGSDRFVEDRVCEKPLNVYGYSKFLFDQYVRRILPSATAQIAGFRYFNVYGPNEQHKGSMASVAFHQNNQIKNDGMVKLFVGSHGYGNGEQRRDFIHVDDVCNVNLFFFDHHDKSGIFNCGSGRAEPFNAIANAVINWHQRGRIEYVDFPEHLLAAYQAYTQADLGTLRSAGYEAEFMDVATGVKRYLDVLNPAPHKNI